MQATITPGMLTAARAAQESIMSSTLTITDPSEGYLFDPETGAEQPALPETVYTGPGRIQRSGSTTIVVGGGQDMPTPTYVGAVPWHVAGLRPGLHITATNPTDPMLPDRFVITEVERNGLAVTARRFHATLLDERHHA